MFDLFIRFAREVKAAGHRRYSAEAIVQRIRWHTQIETKGDDFKLNNWYRALYARMLMEQLPLEFDGFFETREHDRAA